MIYVRHCDIYQRIKVQQAVPTRLIERRTIESLTVVADIGCSPQVKQATCVPIRRAGPLHEVEYCSLWKATEKKISKAIEELVQPSALRWKPRTREGSSESASPPRNPSDAPGRRISENLTSSERPAKRNARCVGTAAPRITSFIAAQSRADKDFAIGADTPESLSCPTCKIEWMAEVPYIPSIAAQNQRVERMGLRVLAALSVKRFFVHFFILFFFCMFGCARARLSDTASAISLKMPSLLIIFFSVLLFVLCKILLVFFLHHCRRRNFFLLHDNFF